MAGARYLRYLILATVSLIIIFFLSSPTAPTPQQMQHQVQTATDKLREKWRGSGNRPQPPPSQPQSIADIKHEKELLEKVNEPSPAAAPVPEAKTDDIPFARPDNKEIEETDDYGSYDRPKADAQGDSDEPEVVKPKVEKPKVEKPMFEKPAVEKPKTAKPKDGKPQSDTITPNTNQQQTPTSDVPKVTKGKMNATFVSLARNGDVYEIAASIRQVEDRFNHQFHYDWVFLNEQPFDEEFKRVTTELVSGTTKYGLIGEEHWSFPSWIDQGKAAQVRQEMGAKKIIYGDSISYRHMCRFESGFFFQQPLMKEYEWYWRVEPSIKLFCDVDYDVFEFMAKNNKKYSFVLSLFEYVETIPTLWDSVKKFISAHPEHIVANNSMQWLSDNDGKDYNHCHFWSNFEVGNLDWLRSKAYVDFFDHLDQEGGFFYERWGDAPVHSIAASLMLPKDQIHFFEDIGYYHVPFFHCPTDTKLRNERKCSCDPKENFDWNGYSCTAPWFEMHGREHPPQTKRKRDLSGMPPHK